MFQDIDLYIDQQAHRIDRVALLKSKSALEKLCCIKVPGPTEPSRHMAP